MRPHFPYPTPRNPIYRSDARAHTRGEWIKENPSASVRIGTGRQMLTPDKAQDDVGSWRSDRKSRGGRGQQPAAVDPL
jgi:hypothetical protein